MKSQSTQNIMSWCLIGRMQLIFAGAGVGAWWWWLCSIPSNSSTSCKSVKCKVRDGVQKLQKKNTFIILEHRHDPLTPKIFNRQVFAMPDFQGNFFFSAGNKVSAKVANNFAQNLFSDIFQNSSSDIFQNSSNGIFQNSIFQCLIRSRSLLCQLSCVEFTKGVKYRKNRSGQ